MGGFKKLRGFRAKLNWKTKPSKPNVVECLAFRSFDEPEYISPNLLLTNENYRDTGQSYTIKEEIKSISIKQNKTEFSNEVMRKKKIAPKPQVEHLFASNVDTLEKEEYKSPSKESSHKRSSEKKISDGSYKDDHHKSTLIFMTEDHGFETETSTPNGSIKKLSIEEHMKFSMHSNMDKEKKELLETKTKIESIDNDNSSLEVSFKKKVSFVETEEIIPQLSPPYFSSYKEEIYKEMDNLTKDFTQSMNLTESNIDDQSKDGEKLYIHNSNDNSNYSSQAASIFFDGGDATPPMRNRRFTFDDDDVSSHGSEASA